MRFSVWILIICFVFVNSLSFALSPEALAIIEQYRQKYNNNADLTPIAKPKPEIPKWTATSSNKEIPAKLVKSEIQTKGSNLKCSKEPLSFKEKNKEASKPLGASLSAALNRYRIARKTGRLVSPSAGSLAVTPAPSPATKTTAKPKLKRYNYNFAMETDGKKAKTITERKKTDKEKARIRSLKASKAKEGKLRIKEPTRASSEKLLEKTDKTLTRTNWLFEKEIKNDKQKELLKSQPAILTQNKEQKEKQADFSLPSYETDEDSDEAIVATQQDDDEFNQFIRRYDFKMPDNYRIIVR